MADEDRVSAAIRRLLDKATDIEVITRDHPVIGPLADVIEAQLIVEIIHGQFGVDIDDVDRERIASAALSLAAEIHDGYELKRRTLPRDQLR